MSALDDIRESARHATVGADDHSDYRDAVEDRIRLLGALDAVLALADEYDEKAKRRGDLSFIPPAELRATMTRALEAGK